jgi:lipoprotein-releasing system permease protein
MSWNSSSSVWLAVRMLTGSKGRILSINGWISLFGLILGVASLVVSMAVISGFQSTLRQSVVDVTGHLQIFKLDPTPEPWQNFLSRLKAIDPRIETAAKFIIFEGVLAHDSHLSGVIIQGVDSAEISHALGLERRVISGALNLTEGAPALEGFHPEDPATVVVGKGVAASFHLKVGDEIRLVVPLNSESDPGQFQRRMGRFKVAGIMDLGKYEYDQRWIVMSLPAAQRLMDVGARYSGLIAKTSDVKEAREIGVKLGKGLGRHYRIRDWQEVNENLFQAIDLEKIVVFFIISVIVVAASFNVASSLYINVVRSASQIAILKTLGLSQKKLTQIFSFQGVFMGMIGAVLGFILGLIFCYGFATVQNEFHVIQGSVYKIDHIDIELRILDWLIIFVITLGICALATWFPARRAARMSVVEAIRQE